MNEDLKQQVIDYSLKLNSTNLSPLRSGNLSVRAKIDDDEGFYITPSGIKYEKLVPILVKAIQELEARVKELEG